MPGAWVAEMGIVLEPGGDVPLGVQLDWALRAAVASGRLRPGERLPGLRDVAAELGVNHNTVRAAVAKLEADGVLETRHGAGTFVAAGATVDARHAELLDEVVHAAHAAGLAPRELAAALYVTPAVTAPGPDDGGARERRALRGDIAVLERLVCTLESRLSAPLDRTPAADRLPRGARLLDAEQLREQRDSIVRRLVTVQQALDAAAGDPEPEPEPGADTAPASAARAKAPRHRRTPRPGISPA
jgi:DNA-binding transcriptional regulator YhcF (GntR family)